MSNEKPLPTSQPPAIDGIILLDKSLEELAIHQETTGRVGCVIWPCALHLLHLIQKELESTTPNHHVSLLPPHATTQRLNVIELGSGTGVVGIGLHQLMHQREIDGQVLLTDIAEMTETLKENINRNHSDIVRAKKVAHEVELNATALNWHSNDDIQRVTALTSFDLIIACECVYSTDNLIISPLIKTIRALMTQQPNEPRKIKKTIISWETRDEDIEKDFLVQLYALAHENKWLLDKHSAVTVAKPSEGNARGAAGEKVYFVTHVLTAGAI